MYWLLLFATLCQEPTIPNEPKDDGPHIIAADWDWYVFMRKSAADFNQHVVVFVKEWPDGKPFERWPRDRQLIWIQEFPGIKDSAVIVGKWNGKYHERYDFPVGTTPKQINDFLYPPPLVIVVPAQNF